LWGNKAIQFLFVLTMKTLADFKITLNAAAPDNSWTAPLKSLWHDAKGDWHKAHAQVDHLDDPDAARVHAYLHRKEGDLSNAGYWYRKAGQSRPIVSLEEEWEELVLCFL
jgi:hypothetical protein